MPSHGSKALDLAQLRAALADGKVWATLGRVTRFEGEAAHFSIVPSEQGDRAEIVVDVELFPHGEFASCRLALFHGLVAIPAEGANVVCLVPQGDYDCDPVIVGVLWSTTGNPTDAGLSETDSALIVASGGVLRVHDGSASDAKFLALKEDVDELRTKLLSHTHDVATTGTATAQTGTAAPTSTSVNAMAGTTVLKAQ